MSTESEQAIVARICHDLITPFNAINLGLEAYEMSKDETLLDCVKESTSKANIILKFMRELFSFKEEGFVYSSRSLGQTIREFGNLYNIDFDLHFCSENISYVSGRIALYNVIMLKEVMPSGGKAFEKITEDGSSITVTYQGSNISLVESECTEVLNHRNVLRYSFLKFLKEHKFLFSCEKVDSQGFIREYLVEE